MTARDDIDAALAVCDKAGVQIKEMAADSHNLTFGQAVALAAVLADIVSTSMDLALTVALPNPDSWGTTCPAWIESADRKCGRPRGKGYLCKRHHGVAVKRLAARQEKDARAAERAAERRAASLPKWRAELARIEKRMRVLDPPPPTDDMAAYGGVEVKAITRYQRRMLSDSRVEEMARLVTRAEQLRRWIGTDRGEGL